MHELLTLRPSQFSRRPSVVRLALSHGRAQTVIGGRRRPCIIGAHLPRLWHYDYGRGYANPYAVSTWAMGSLP
jgi:hypothetical protein